MKKPLINPFITTGYVSPDYFCDRIEETERIINAMIEHYQTKLEVMTYIVNQLKTIRNGNQINKENENTSL